MITPARIIALAFANAAFSQANILQADIDRCLESWVRPLLGDALTEEIQAQWTLSSLPPANAKLHSDFVEPALAWLSRSRTLLRLLDEPTNLPQSPAISPAAERSAERGANDALRMGLEYLHRARRYLECSNALHKDPLMHPYSYPLFAPQSAYLLPTWMP